LLNKKKITQNVFRLAMRFLFYHKIIITNDRFTTSFTLFILEVMCLVTEEKMYF